MRLDNGMVIDVLIVVCHLYNTM